MQLPKGYKISPSFNNAWGEGGNILSPDGKFIHHYIIDRFSGYEDEPAIPAPVMIIENENGKLIEKFSFSWEALPPWKCGVKDFLRLINNEKEQA